MYWDFLVSYLQTSANSIPWKRSRLTDWLLCYTALTATPAGKKTFARLGFVPSGYKEMFQLVDTPSPSTPAYLMRSNGDDTGGAHSNASLQTTVTTKYIYPGQTSIGELSSGVISESEMTVRYCSTSP